MLPSLISGSTPFKNRFANPPIVIDASGIGDFTNLTDAIAKHGDTIYFINGTITENLSLTSSCKIVGNGIDSVIDGTIDLDDADLELWDMQVTGAITLSSVAAPVNLLLDGGEYLTVNLFDSGSGGTVETRNAVLIHNTAGNGILTNGIAPGQCVLKINPGTRILADGVASNGISTNATFDETNSYIHGAYIYGEDESITSGAAINVNAFHGVFDGTVNANVTLLAAGNNVTI